MIEHLSLPVRDLAASGRFYDAVLSPLGIVRSADRDGAIGYSRPGALAACLWLLQATAQSASPGRGFHVSFVAESREMVRSFHSAGLEAGGRDAGAPGERPHYASHFYGAFVIDPDGFKLEATHRSR